MTRSKYSREIAAEEKGFICQIKFEVLHIKTLWHLGNQVFQCQSDAEKALKTVIKSTKYHHIHYEILPVESYPCKGRPKTDAQKIITGYQIQACLATHLDAVKAKKDTLGRFILATNQHEYSLLDNHSILK